MLPKDCDRGLIKSQSSQYKPGQTFGCSNDLEAWDCTKRVVGYHCSVTVKSDEICSDSPKNFNTSTNMTCEDKKWLNEMIGYKTLNFKLKNGSK